MGKRKNAEDNRIKLNMRTSKELYDQVVEAAKKSGRSLMQEVEFRVEKSFWREEQMGFREYNT